MFPLVSISFLAFVITVSGLLVGDPQWKQQEAHDCMEFTCAGDKVHKQGAIKIKRQGSPLNENQCCEDSPGVGTLVEKFGQRLSEAMGEKAGSERLLVKWPPLSVNRQDYDLTFQAPNKFAIPNLAKLGDMLHLDAFQRGGNDGGYQDMRLSELAERILDRTVPDTTESFDKAVACLELRFKAAKDEKALAIKLFEELDECDQELTKKNGELTNTTLRSYSDCLLAEAVFDGDTSNEAKSKLLKHVISTCSGGAGASGKAFDVCALKAATDAAKMLDDHSNLDNKLRRQKSRCSTVAAQQSRMKKLQVAQFEVMCQKRARDLLATIDLSELGCHPEHKRIVDTLAERAEKRGWLQEAMTPHPDGGQFARSSTTPNDIDNFFRSEEELTRNNEESPWTREAIEFEMQASTKTDTSTTTSSSVSVGVPGLFELKAKKSDSSTESKGSTIQLKTSFSFKYAQVEFRHTWFPRMLLHDPIFVMPGYEMGGLHSGGSWDASGALSYRTSAILCKDIMLTISSSELSFQSKSREASASVSVGVTAPVYGVPVKAGGERGEERADSTATNQGSSTAVGLDRPGTGICGYMLQLVHKEPIPGRNTMQEATDESSKQRSQKTKETIETLKKLHMTERAEDDTQKGKQSGMSGWFGRGSKADGDL
eukprot:TRINITY_DN24898_c0_g1_i1.p1 TRINITY_DN24898_c0_g1~~TRINITY_DN24898_c0_g1_i1.p1  ORF type:complete len:655 (+),score=81.86 TRINITY_DN24898_c0_g1_i1:112-2076(+)